QLGRRAAHVRRSVRVRRARARRPAAPRRPAGRARLRRPRQRPRHAPGPALLGLVRADDARARHPPRGWAPRPDVPHARTRGRPPTVRAGLGHAGGISSLSKACIIGPPSSPGADVDYTFAQVEVTTPLVDYKGNCGNCSSAVGPFAIDERLVPAVEGETRVRIHNTNTRKLIVAHVPVKGGEAAVAGDFELAGVSGHGARIALDFLDPGGARVISMGNCHRAFALTAAMCLAVAARIVGTVVHECAGPTNGDVRLGHPSGVLPIDALVRVHDGAPWAERVTVYRTARRLMEGFVRVP